MLSQKATGTEQSFYVTIIASEQAQGSYVKLNEQLATGLIQNEHGIKD